MGRATREETAQVYGEPGTDDLFQTRLGAQAGLQPAGPLPRPQGDCDTSTYCYRSLKPSTASFQLGWRLPGPCWPWTLPRSAGSVPAARGARAASLAFLVTLTVYKPVRRASSIKVDLLFYPLLRARPGCVSPGGGSLPV